MGLRRGSRSTKDGVVASIASSGAAGKAGAATEKVGRAARKAGRATEKAGAELSARKPFTASQAKRMIGVSKAVAPLLAPYALAAATVARGRWDAYRAARMGVEPGQLAAFSGPGGALHARLSRVAEALATVESTGSDGKRFATDTRARLEDLAVAVRAAEQMPSSRRRAAFRAIGAELDRIETTLLTHLGVDTSRSG